MPIPPGIHQTGRGEHVRCFCSGSGPPVPLYGSRAPCGDGRVDSGEACDDGSPGPGDCCRLDCTPARAGGACADDGNVCTDEACDGAGACLHLANTASCDSTCAPGGVCNGGACMPPAPAPAGTPCDRDGSACSVDACDGAGQCVRREALDCGPCGFCQPPGGCAARVRDICAAAGGRARLDLRKGATADRDRAVFTWTDASPGDPVAPFGDPTTTTDFALCIHQPPADPDALSTPVGALAIAGGDSCGGRPCWSATRNGFRRHDPGAWPAGGAPRVRLRAAARDGTALVVRGAGTPLGLPTIAPTLRNRPPLIGRPLCGLKGLR